MAIEGLQQAQEIIKGKKIEGMTKQTIATMQDAAKQALEKIRLQAKQIEMAGKGRADLRLLTLKGTIDGMLQQQEQQHEILLQLLKEQGSKEVERHSVALHDEAAQLAEARLEGRDTRTAVRDDGMAERAETRQAAQAVGQAKVGSALSVAEADQQAARDTAARMQEAELSEQAAEQQAQRAAALAPKTPPESGEA